MSFIGLNVNSNILFSNDLNLKEVVLLSALIGLSKKTGECYPSNEYLKRIVKVTSKTRVSQLVNALVKKKYIITKQDGYGKRIISMTLKTKQQLGAIKAEKKTETYQSVPTTREAAFRHIGQLNQLLGVH